MITLRDRIGRRSWHIGRLAAGANTDYRTSARQRQPSYRQIRFGGVEDRVPKGNVMTLATGARPIDPTAARRWAWIGAERRPLQGFRPPKGNQGCHLATAERRVRRRSIGPRSRYDPGCVKYPFEPRSTAYLQPGQFWSVPLSDGRFACGRVLDVPRPGDPQIPASTRTFLAGLLDWVSDSVPSETAIGGARLLEQGFVHVRAIRETGGTVLGLRPLDADGVEPYLWVTTGFLPQAWVYRGAQPVRRATSADRSLPVMGVWGYRVISVIAEHAFVAGR